MAEEIIQKGGCLISEYPAGTLLNNYQYVQRDRIQSGISQGIVIMEAEENSGTMHTAEFAEKQYRMLACYDRKLSEPASGNKRLIEEGKAVPITTEEDLEHFVRTIEKPYKQLNLFDNL